MVILVRVMLMCWLLVGAVRWTAGGALPTEPEVICRRIESLMNSASKRNLFVLGRVLREQPAAWNKPLLLPGGNATSFSVAKVRLFGRTLKAVTWTSDGTCASTSLSLWSEDYSTMFSRWTDRAPEYAFGFGEWLLTNGPYIMLSDSGQKHFRIFQIEADGDATPMCEGRKLSFVHEHAEPDATDAVCASLPSPDAISPVVEKRDDPIPLDEALQVGVDRSHLSLRDRARMDLDNDGAPEWVGFARYFIDTAACGDPTDVVWPLVLDEGGNHAPDTETNRALMYAMGVGHYGPVMQASMRLIDFRGARYIEQRSLPASLQPLHKVFRLDGGKVSTVCDFHPLLQYEVLPIIDEKNAKGVGVGPPG